MLPWIIAGNLVLVVVYALMAKGECGWVRWCVAGVIATAAKYIVMALGQTLVLTSAKGLAFGVALGTAAAAQVVQIITARIALILAKLLITALPKSIKDLK